MVGLIDTSVFIGVEHGRVDLEKFPTDVAVPVPVLAELEVGVLLSPDIDRLQLRLTTLQLANSLAPVPIDVGVARAWSRITSHLKDSGLRAPINDVWIAATAVANEMSVLTQDSDYDNMPEVKVVRI